MVLILASCQKAINKPATSSITDDGMAFVDTTNATETIVDTTWFYDSQLNDEDIFDSCTGEYVHLWGTIHNRSVNWFTDSVKQINTSEIDYKNFHAVGDVSGQEYSYKQNLKSIQYDEWGGEWFVEKVNFYHAHTSLTLKVANATSYVTDTYYYFVADNAGNLIINQQHYDFGSCH